MDANVTPARPKTCRSEPTAWRRGDMAGPSKRDHALSAPILAELAKGPRTTIELAMALDLPMHTVWNRLRPLRWEKRVRKGAAHDEPWILLGLKE